MSSIRDCARLSFAAATSSRARVIFRVLRIDLTRRLMSWTVAMGLADERVGLLDVEGLQDLLDLLAEPGSDLVGQVAAFPDLPEDRAFGPQMLDELLDEARHVVHGDVVEV